MKRFTFTKTRLIGLICSALLPAMAMGIGTSMLIKNVVFHTGFAIVYYLLPLIAAGILGLCVFCNCKTWKKVVLSGVILMLFLMSFSVSSILMGWTQVKCYEETDALQQYTGIKSESEMMPKWAELGETTAIEYSRVSSFCFIFSSRTDYLICSYMQEEYESQKNRLNTAYTFQTEAITDDYSNCEPMIEMDGYQFRMLSVEGYELYYPKNIILIGYSDDERKIVYLEFYDADLDYITSLQEFITYDCGWKYIR